MEKKRRARINKSLQELRLLIADTDVREHLQLFVANKYKYAAIVALGSQKSCLQDAFVSSALVAIKVGEC